MLSDGRHPTEKQPELRYHFAKQFSLLFSCYRLSSRAAGVLGTVSIATWKSQILVRSSFLEIDCLHVFEPFWSLFWGGYKLCETLMAFWVHSATRGSRRAVAKLQVFKVKQLFACAGKCRHCRTPWWKLSSVMKKRTVSDVLRAMYGPYLCMNVHIRSWEALLLPICRSSKGWI